MTYNSHNILVRVYNSYCILYRSNGDFLIVWIDRYIFAQCPVCYTFAAVIIRPADYSVIIILRSSLSC